MAGFSFQDSSNMTLNGSVNLDTIKTVVYDDGAGNKYTFGVDGNKNDEFKTFQYEPSSGGAVDYSALATQFMSGGVVGKLLDKLMTIETINTNVGTIQAAVGKGSGSLGKALEELDTKVGQVKVKTDKLDLADATAKGTLGEALDKLAKTTDLTLLAKADQLPSNLTERLEVLNLADTAKGLGKALSELAKANQLPSNLTERLEVLNLADTAKGLGKALETISAEATANLNALKALLDALNPDASSKSLLSATLKEIKDKTDKLDLKNTDTNSGTLGEALGKLATAEQLSELDGKLITTESKTVLMHADLTDLLEALEAKALVPEPESPQSNSGHTPNEDMLGEYSHDQFLG